MARIDYNPNIDAWRVIARNAFGRDDEVLDENGRPAITKTEIQGLSGPGEYAHLMGRVVKAVTKREGPVRQEIVAETTEPAFDVLGFIGPTIVGGARPGGPKPSTVYETTASMDEETFRGFREAVYEEAMRRYDRPPRWATGGGFYGFKTESYAEAVKKAQEDLDRAARSTKKPPHAAMKEHPRSPKGRGR